MKDWKRFDVIFTFCHRKIAGSVYCMLPLFRVETKNLQFLEGFEIATWRQPFHLFHSPLKQPWGVFVGKGWLVNWNLSTVPPPMARVPQEIAGLFKGFINNHEPVNNHPGWDRLPYFLGERLHWGVLSLRFSCTFDGENGFCGLKWNWVSYDKING